MTSRRLTAHAPVWARAAGIIALVLVGVVVSAMLLEAADIGGRGGPGRHSPGGTQMDSGGHGPRDRERGGGHSPADATQRSDHNTGRGGSAASALWDLAAARSPGRAVAIEGIVFVLLHPAAHPGGRA